MEQRPDTPPILPSGRFGPERQLPSGLNKVERISQQARGLVDDVTSFVDLRVKLAKMEMQAEMEAKAKELGVLVVAGVIALTGLLYGLTALAWFLGGLLGHPAWGFLCVMVLLLIVAGALKALQPRIARAGDPSTLVDAKRLQHPDDYPTRRKTDSAE